MSDTNSPFQLRYILNPLYWPTWLGLGFLWLTTRMPYRVILFLGASLGLLSMLLLADRRRVTRTNIRLCFPELSRKEQRRLIRRNFYSNGMALFETALAWWGSEKKLQPLLHIEGLDNLRQAEAKGNGVIMLGGHYATLEMGGRVMSAHTNKVVPTYKSARNKVFELVMARSRKKTYDDLIKSMNMRDVMRALKNNKFIWYAPDQDFDRKSSVFAPFMGIPATTLTLSSRLAKVSGASVVPWYSERLPDAQGYKVTIGPALDNFPSGDDVQDAIQINDLITVHVRHVPEQYLWGHRRFKTRPPGAGPIYRPKRDRAMRRYTLLLTALSIPVFLYCIAIAIRYRNFRFFSERLGLGNYAKDVDFWIHAASVGEINAVSPLLNLLKQHHPEARILLTTNTPTGYETARNKLAGITIQFLPVDWFWATARFFNRVNPKCPLIFETELWPNLYEYAYGRNQRITLVNGRLSDKSMRTTGWSRLILNKCMQYVHTILARSKLDKERFMKLGAREDKLKVIGNIKWATNTKREAQPVKLPKPYILLASTRDDEEKLLCQSMDRLLHEGNYLFTIIPRHPKRLSKILNDLHSLNLNIAVRSRKETVTDKTQVYIADTFGEMNRFIAGADLVVMGGSFVPRGGQNILEVANQGKAVVFGPYMNNFLDEADTFVQLQAGLQVNAEELDQTINMLLSDENRRNEIGKNGLALVEQNRDIVSRYYDEIMQICDQYRR